MHDLVKKQKSKEGFTMINHELYEWSMASGLGAPELRTVHAIIRQTSGWGREEAPMSLRFIGKMTNTHHWNVDKAIKKLLIKKIIFRRTGDEMKWGKCVHVYRLNKELCRISNASQKDCHTTDASTAVNNTPEPAVCGTPIKDIKQKKKIEVKNKDVQKAMNKLEVYKKHRD